ncbi:MAG: adenylosuccinate synthase [Sandaracinaceae bacterium]
MSVVAVVGVQWGDEGKGKIVELLAGEDALIAQYAGGYSAGQSLVAEGERLVFHAVPSEALSRGHSVLLAQGMALDPRLILDELGVLEQHHAQKGELFVDQRAQVVLPHHIELDRLRGEEEGASGTPRRGIGPAYGDRVGRTGVRIGDLLFPDALPALIERSIQAARPALAALGGEVPDVTALVDAYASAGEKLRPRIVDGSRRIAERAKNGQPVVLEGPFGTMVDLDHGYYPYVVSASTVVGGACAGTGISPSLVERVVGVAKAYTTRSGSGPLPSELTGEIAKALQDQGGEISPTTAQPRRCGMFDVPVLRYAARVNGMHAVALTKLDVLTGLESIPMCVGYELDGVEQDEPPFEGQGRMKPIVEQLPGWTESLGDCRGWDELPANARAYVETIEKKSGVPVTMVGVGKDRAQTIHR